MGVWYMANTASSEVVSVCKERGVGWGCATWPTLPALRQVSMCKERGVGGVAHGQHYQFLA